MAPTAPVAGEVNGAAGATAAAGAVAPDAVAEATAFPDPMSVCIPPGVAQAHREAVASTATTRRIRRNHKGIEGSVWNRGWRHKSI